MLGAAHDVAREHGWAVIAETAPERPWAVWGEDATTMASTAAGQGSSHRRLVQP